MDTREFLERVLPLEGGDYFGASIGPNNKYAQTKLESLDALSAYIEGKKQQHHNVFFATGTYAEQRLAKDTQFKKALYVDIDTGIDKPYSTKKQAVGEVARFIKESKFLKPSIIVDSGNGVHVYWTLDKPVALVLGDTNLTGGEGQDEPFWMFQLQLLAFCEDGHDYLHTMSDGHASYDFNRTEKKFAIQKQKVIEKKVGPILCKTLGKSAPDMPMERTHKHATTTG